MASSVAAAACTSAFCERQAAVLVAWRTNPDGLPFCAPCAHKLSEHGDRILPLPEPAIAMPIAS